MTTKLTVLMAVHNGERYLRAAIDSILQQTYSDFRFLIVDDASTDGTREIVRSYQDGRINLVCLAANVGQTAALNAGLHRTTTPWIARMDDDDYSAPTRLEKQMRALDADPSLSCVGTHAWTFRDDPRVAEGVITTPLHHADIKRALLRGSPIIHGSIVVSTAALLDVGGYNERYRVSADVELYDRLLYKYTAATIPEQLLGIRRHTEQRSRSRVAFDDTIEIYSGRLLTDKYSHREAAIIRETLSRSYLYRARTWGSEHRYWQAWRDIWRAFLASPKSFWRDSVVVFAVSLISERNRARLRRRLLRSAPGQSRRW
jgi:glycosyltransferase involved in cell wall biosynthesis